MKTIVHLHLTDEQRNKLYCVWNDTHCKKMVSRSDVTDRLNTHIEEELAQYHEQHNKRESVHEPISDAEADESRGALAKFIDSPRREIVVVPPERPLLPDYPALEDACKRVLEHISDNKAVDCVNVGWCCSILLATGVQ